MDPDTNIYSEPFFPLSQAWPSSSSSATLTQTQQSQQASQRISRSISVGGRGEEVDEEVEAVADSQEVEKVKKFDLSKRIIRASHLHQEYCTTGCTQLDAAFKGGVQTFGITEIFGEGGTGKTQFCLQLTLSAQLPRNVGGLESDVFYICTEDKFPSKRLAQLVHHFRSKFPTQLSEDAMSHIFIEHVAESESLLQCVTVKLANLARSNPTRIRMVLLDSVAAIFRSEYDNIVKRTAELRRLGQALHEFSLQYKAAIVVCNQVTGSPTNEGNIASLGMTWKNMITTRIRLSKSGNHQNRCFHVMFSPHIPTIDVPFQVSADGVQGLK